MNLVVHVRKLVYHVGRIEAIYAKDDIVRELPMLTCLQVQLDELSYRYALLERRSDFYSEKTVAQDVLPEINWPRDIPPDKHLQQIGSQ